MKTNQTAVTEFSQWHSGNKSPLPNQRYRQLVPTTQPGKGEQYAFEVNLDQCTGCKACVVACHSLNGLDEDESWRDVGMLLGRKFEPYQQTVTTACHHCVEPACADGCPVLAYDKNPITGIVSHLDDQCIGCSYCILKCPYEVPKYNKKRGIVRKCDMCQGRLAAGQAPACVQACPNGAIAIKVIKPQPPEGSLLPGVFRSSYTHPTTTYVSSKPIPAEAVAADVDALAPGEAHMPLGWMLVFTQASAGMALANAVFQVSGLALVAAIVGVLGILLSVTHLGQPLKAWKAFLGWRKSWLSREIIAFGLFAKLLLASTMRPLLAWPTAIAGLVAVACSAMVYIDTQRPFWCGRMVFPKFFGTSLLLGCAMAGLMTWSKNQPLSLTLATLAVVLHGGLYLWERQANRNAAYLRSQRLMQVVFPKLLSVRRGLLLGSLLPALPVAWPTGGVGVLLLLVITLFASQLGERFLFFTCVAGPKMPGN